MSSTPSTRRSRIVFPVVIAIAALALAAMAASGSGGDSTREATDSSSGGSAPAADAGADSEPAQTDVARSDEAMALGDVDAPVVMLAFSEFQCPYCKRFAHDTLPTLISRYVDTGVLRIEWRDFPFLGEESTHAARGARAAAAQGAFWEYHDQLFAFQAASPNSGQLTDQYLIDMAESLGLDVERFTADLRHPGTEAAIRIDRDAGLALGVTGTPALFVNGTPVVGAQPLEVFVQAIEAAASAS